MYTLNVNPPRVLVEFYELFPPRDAGRGSAKKSTGEVVAVGYSAAGITLDGALIIARPGVEPTFLDVCFDQLDRPQICWREAGATYLYFYNGLIAGYDLFAVGADAAQPILAHDYLLDGVNTVLAYLKNGVPHYRLQSERFTLEHQWYNTQKNTIAAFGYGLKTNSIQLIFE